jgi:hypothetical protein
MSKSKFNEPEVIPVKNETVNFAEASPVYDRKAFSTFKNKFGWHLLEIPYNSNTMETGTPVVLITNTEQMEIEFQFQVASGKELFD